MQIVVGVVPAAALTGTLDVVIAGDSLDVGEQAGLPEGGDDRERFVKRRRCRVVHEIARDQQNAVGHIHEARHPLAQRLGKGLDRRKQPA